MLARLWKPLVLALACVLVAATGWAEVTSRGTPAARQHPAGAVASANAGELLIWRIVAAAQDAANGPHGDIGDAAVATAP